MIKKICLDNAGEFISHAFHEYSMSIGIEVEHSVAHVHNQNGLTESLIKRIKLVARSLLMRASLPMSTLGLVVLHATTLFHIKPTSYHKYSIMQLVFWQEPNISPFWVRCICFNFLTKRDYDGSLEMIENIYVEYDYPIIIKYLEPSIWDFFILQFVDYHFDKYIFPTLKGEKKLENDISWNELSLSRLDPLTKECEPKVQRITHLQY